MAKKHLTLLSLYCLIYFCISQHSWLSAITIGQNKPSFRVNSKSIVNRLWRKVAKNKLSLPKS